MSLKSILGQDHIIRTFQRAISENRLSHAYLFLGREGVGKSLLATELAKALFCEQSNGDSCGRCRECLRIEHGNHPDVHFVEREEGKQDLPVAAIHELQRRINFKAIEGKRKIFIILEADRMNEEGSNCFLKTLEEPPDDSLLILLATRLDIMLPTIVSRCQIMRFRPLPAEIVEKKLRENLDIEESTAKFLAPLSDGSIGYGQDLYEQGTIEERNWLISKMSNLRLEDNFRVAEEMKQLLTAEGEKLQARRAHIMQLLDLLLTFYRDILFIRMNGGSSTDVQVLNADIARQVQAESQRLSERQVTTIIEAIITTHENIGRNANINLAVENMLTDVASILTSA